jgi:hypothetical protein
MESAENYVSKDSGLLHTCVARFGFVVHKTEKLPLDFLYELPLSNHSEHPLTKYLDADRSLEFIALLDQRGASQGQRDRNGHRLLIRLLVVRVSNLLTRIDCVLTCSHQKFSIDF